MVLIFIYRKYLNLQFARIFSVFMLLFLAKGLYAQQDPVYTQYFENLMAINPAYAGAKGMLSAMAISRNQWVAMAHAPVTRSFMIHSPVANTNMGLGLSLLSDQIYPINQTSLDIDYSYTLHFTKRRDLALGLKGGISFYEAGISGLLTNDPNDPVFANDINRNFLPNFGVGAFYHTDRYYLGLSIPKLIRNTINKNAVEIEHVNKGAIHLFLVGGCVFDVNKTVKFKPSVLTIIARNTPLSFDLNGTFLFNDRLWLGAMYRLGDSFGGLFQVQATKQFKIGYSYDLPISRLGAYNKGTHEVMVVYDFNYGRRRIRTPLYF